MERFLQIFKVKELRNKILVVLGLLVAYRVLAAIPIPGVNGALVSGQAAGDRIIDQLSATRGVRV